MTQIDTRHEHSVSVDPLSELLQNCTRPLGSNCLVLDYNMCWGCELVSTNAFRLLYKFLGDKDNNVRYVALKTTTLGVRLEYYVFQL